MPQISLQSSGIGTPLHAALNIHKNSKSFPGLSCKNISATPAVFVCLISAITTVLSSFPFGVNIPSGVTAYLAKCLGCASAGFPPQYITKSALFFTSPKVILGSPTP